MCDKRQNVGFCVRGTKKENGRSEGETVGQVKEWVLDPRWMLGLHPYKWPPRQLVARECWSQEQGACSFRTSSGSEQNQRMDLVQKHVQRELQGLGELLLLTALCVVGHSQEVEYMVYIIPIL